MIRRKNIRLRSWDYSSNAAYHVTICSFRHVCIFGSIDLDDETMIEDGETHRTMVKLSEAGRVVERALLETEEVFPGVTIENYVIMPNHVHVLLTVVSENATTLGAIVGRFKGRATSLVGKTSFRGKLWQRGYYDHIIRNDQDFSKVWEYIEGNPGKWLEDEYYQEGKE